jgi:hypothetical protein
MLRTLSPKGRKKYVLTNFIDPELGRATVSFGQKTEASSHDNFVYQTTAIHLILRVNLEVFLS